MRTVLGWIATILMACRLLTGEAYAQADEIVSEATERIESIFDTPENTDHLGLLGKNYVQFRYHQERTPNPYERRYDASVQGMDAVVNLHAKSFDLVTKIDVDLFFDYTHLGIDGSRSDHLAVYRDFGPVSRIEARANFYTIGMTVYPTECDPIRPFLQVGIGFEDFTKRLTLAPDLLGVPPYSSEPYKNFSGKQSNPFLNLGFELDLWDSVGYRMTLLMGPNTKLQDSVLLNDFVLWPNESLFVRCGLANQLDGGGLEVNFGGGLVF